MRATAIALAPILFVSLLVGCAGTPEAPQELVEARSAVEQMKNDPLVGQFENDADQAESELASAERALSSDDDPEIVKHRAYLATQYATLVSTQADDARVRQSIESANEKRQSLQLQAREADAQRAVERANQLSDELEALKTQQTDDTTVLTLTDVLFDSNESVLKAGAANTLNKIAGYLEESDSSTITVEGYTDSQGDAQFNQQLSQERADSVRMALVQRGVSEERITAVGKGENFPVASNDSAAGRQQNRRVEIVVQP